jgi:hypothetical protein
MMANRILRNARLRDQQPMNWVLSESGPTMAYECTSIFATWGAALAPAKAAPLLCALKAANP